MPLALKMDLINSLIIVKSNREENKCHILIVFYYIYCLLNTLPPARNCCIWHCFYDTLLFLSTNWIDHYNHWPAGCVSTENWHQWCL